MKNLYETWMVKEGLRENNKTNNGYFKAPSSILTSRWVKLAWDDINPNLVK